jgi:murein L,D-transpeptidase YcbB/YkuD
MPTRGLAETAAPRRQLFAVLALAVLAYFGPLVAHGVASADASTDSLRALVATGRLADLRWPDFSDYRGDVQSFYDASGYAPAWSRNGQPTPQAAAIIEILQQADFKGLGAEDYDASRWAARAKQLNQPDGVARFDLALTVCLMRYVSDLEVGRVNPKQVKFSIKEKNSRYDLAQFLRQDLVTASDLNAALAPVEPPYLGYQRALVTLRHYLELARQDSGEQLPVPSKKIEAGSPYDGAARLAARLRELGDLPADAAVAAGDLYQAPLVDAVKHFQERHGLDADGVLGAQTVKQLNIPLSARVDQLGLALERWRWAPHEFLQPPVVVNIPAFRLRAYDANGKLALTSNVIVGKAMRHGTPVFDRDMQYVVFRPYWNVPPSIQRSEIVPAIERDRSYIATRNYEVITPAGQVVTSGAISDEVLEQLKARKLAVRQKPGPKNALGLVKLIFPNEYNVYLHSTPSQQLFARSRRDFSHGCIRVEKADELAAWALQGNPAWSLDKVREAMQNGKDNVQVNLPKPIPVLIVYGTAVTDELGTVRFYDDIYGHDATLKKALAQGYPYHR